MLHDQIKTANGCTSEAWEDIHIGIHYSGLIEEACPLKPSYETVEARGNKLVTFP